MTKALEDKIALLKELGEKVMLKKYRKLYHLAKPTMKKGEGPKLRQAFRLVLEAYEGVQYQYMEALGLAFDEVYDLFAVRIILETSLTQEKTISGRFTRL